MNKFNFTGKSTTKVGMVKVGTLKSLNDEKSRQQKEERATRAALIWSLWDLCNGNVSEFCHFVRVTIFNLTERELASAIGMKPISVKKIEQGIESGETTAPLEIALFGLLNLYMAEGDTKLLGEKITCLKNLREENMLQKQLVSDLLALIDSSSRDISRFIKLLFNKYRLHKEEAAFVMDKTPEELEKLLSGECSDSRRLFGEIDFKIDEFAKRLATAIVEPLYEKSGGEGGLVSEAGSAECLPTAKAMSKVAASNRTGEVSLS